MALGMYLLQIPPHGTTEDPASNATQAMLGLLDRVLTGGGVSGADSSSSFFFLGTTERFNESVCLFHALASTDMQRRNGALPVPNQFVNKRASSNATGLDWEEEILRCDLPSSLLTQDALDTALFSYANVRLNRSLEAIMGASAGLQRATYQNCMDTVAAWQQQGRGRWGMAEGAWLMDEA